MSMNKVNTFSKWIPRESKFESIQTISMSCPNCRAAIRMVVPPETNLYNWRDEAEHWRSRAESLHKEVLALRLALFHFNPSMIPNANNKKTNPS